jgi:hypothetical protein
MSTRRVGVGVLCFLMCSTSVSATIIIERWDIGTGVVDSGGVYAAGTDIVQNPFNETYDIVHGNSMANTDFIFSWNDTTGNFLIQASHRAADVDPHTLFSTTFGLINVSADQDLLMTAQGAYAYSLPAWSMGVIFFLGVYEDVPPYDVPLQFGDAYSTDGNPPPASGIISGGGQAILPAGHTWTIQYRFEVETNGTTGTAATGDGYIHFTLAEVPEIATILPLALGAMLLRHRRNRNTR